VRISVLIIFVILLSTSAMVAGCSGAAGPSAFRAEWRAPIGADDLDEAIGVAITKNVLSVSDSKRGAILRFSDEGETIQPWRHDLIDRPMHIANGPDDRLYVPDYLNDRIIVFNPEGEAVLQFGEHGTTSGRFDSPAGVAVGEDRTIYVADFNNHRVQRFDQNGTFIFQWGGKGRRKPGHFYYPTDVAVGPRGQVFVADAYNHRVQVFTAEGKHLQTIGSHGADAGEFDVAIGIAVDHQGRLFVADQFNHRVQVFDHDGASLGAFGSHGTGRAQFDRPNDVACEQNGNVYVADFGNGRVQVFTLVAIQPENRQEQEAWDESGASRSSLGRWWY